MPHRRAPRSTLCSACLYWSFLCFALCDRRFALRFVLWTSSPPGFGSRGCVFAFCLCRSLFSHSAVSCLRCASFYVVISSLLGSDRLSGLGLIF